MKRKKTVLNISYQNRYQWTEELLLIWFYLFFTFLSACTFYRENRLKLTSMDDKLFEWHEEGYLEITMFICWRNPSLTLTALNAFLGQSLRFGQAVPRGSVITRDSVSYFHWINIRHQCHILLLFYDECSIIYLS